VAYLHTEQRDRAMALAPSDPRAALVLARGITAPWFRCQALAAAARYLDPQSAAQVLTESFAAAEVLDDPNRVVTCSSWTLKVLAGVGPPFAVEAEVVRLLGIIEPEDSPVRRADALVFLLEAVASTHRELAARVARCLVAACVQPLIHGGRNKKGAYLLERTLPAIWAVDPDLAMESVSRLPTSRAARAAVAIRALQPPSEECAVHVP